MRPGGGDERRGTGEGTAVRWLGNRSCPKCGRAARRVHRRFVDRIISLFTPVRRYCCWSPLCGWEGNLPEMRRKQGEWAR